MWAARLRRSLFNLLIGSKIGSLLVFCFKYCKIHCSVALTLLHGIGLPAELHHSTTFNTLFNPLPLPLPFKVGARSPRWCRRNVMVAALFIHPEPGYLGNILDPWQQHLLSVFSLNHLRDYHLESWTNTTTPEHAHMVKKKACKILPRSIMAGPGRKVKQQ